jgi:hypothetical protein
MIEHIDCIPPPPYINYVQHELYILPASSIKYREVLTIPENARQMMSMVIFVDAPQRADPIKKDIKANKSIGFLPKISDRRP